MSQQTLDKTWFCPECAEEVAEKKLRGPHLSACRRILKAKYAYLDGDTKHPYEEKACPTCGERKLMQVRRTYCSYRCSKLGDLNPSKQRASGHGLTPSQYAAVHDAVRRQRGSAFGCAHCGTSENRVYHWANISGNYEDVYDYINLCVPCHDRFDRAKNMVAA